MYFVTPQVKSVEDQKYGKVFQMIWKLKNRLIVLKL